MGDVNVIPLVDEGLGNSAYLVDLADGRAGNREYSHTGLADGDEGDLGGLTLRTFATPGHTHEHIAFELLEGSRTVGVSTGGSLLVGSAARTDLVAPERTEDLARAQYRSLQRLARMADDVAVWPTHGAGSFCSAPPEAERKSTIGAERATNSLLRAENEDVFVKQLLDSLGSFPAYFLRLPELNRRGPALIDGDALPPLGAAEVAGLQASGAVVVDVRPMAEFAAGHVPGSVSIELRPVFATWLGWLVDADKPLVIVRNADQDPAEIVWQARKVGYDLIAGELDTGVPGWIAAGEPTSSIPLIGADGIVVMCGHGQRAFSAASMLVSTGRQDVAVLAGRPQDWVDSTGRPLAGTS